MKSIIKKLYSDGFQDKAYKMLSGSDRVTVHEYRNFVDFDLIPFIRNYIEKNILNAKKEVFDAIDQFRSCGRSTDYCEIIDMSIEDYEEIKKLHLTLRD